MSRVLAQSILAHQVIAIVAVVFTLSFTSTSYGFQTDSDSGANAPVTEVAEDESPDEESNDKDSKTSSTGGVSLPWFCYLIPLFGLLGLGFTFWKSKWVSEQEVGTEKMATIAKHITEGAMSFLKAEYSVLAIFVIAVAILLGYAGASQGEMSSPMIALSFGLGAICSALAGFVGMKVATKANVRTTNAARKGLGQALEVAFAGGSVMGMGVVGLGVLGLSILFIVYSCLLYTSPSPRDLSTSRMPSSA